MLPQTDPRRRFNAREREVLYVASDGLCECTGCGACAPSGCHQPLGPGWHADHVEPHSRGGRTELFNGAAKCPPCNLAKAAKVDDRARAYEWQLDLVGQYLTADPPRYLVAAWTGLGKTRAAAKISAALAHREPALAHVVLCPTDDVARGWRTALHAEGLHLKRIGKDQNDRTVAGVTCICGAPATALVMTYALCAAHPYLLLAAVRGPHVLHLDEVHHLRNGSTDRAWITPLVAASMLTRRVICYSATPERSDAESIPWVHTKDAASTERDPLPERWTYVRGYGMALTARGPKPVTSVVFERFDGDAEWWEEDVDDGSRVERKERISGDHAKALQRKVRRHALNSRGNWLKDVLTNASAKRAELALEHARAGAIGIARDTNHAVAMADELIEQGERPVFVYTNDYMTDDHRIGNGWPDEETGQRPGHKPLLSNSLLDEFKKADAPWIVSVKKLSEGIDVSRLRVLVYATTVATWLAFIQAVGRVIRTDWSLPSWADQCAWTYILNDKTMSGYAAEIENQQVDAFLAQDDEDGTIGCGGGAGPGPGGERRRSEGFIASAADYAGATISGQELDAELMAVAARVGLAGTELGALRKLWEAGLLGLPGIAPSAAPSASMAVDPQLELNDQMKKKNEWVGKWAGARVRSGEFSGSRAMGEAFAACHTELGDGFGVWAKSADVTAEQVRKAAQWAEERTRELWDQGN